MPDASAEEIEDATQRQFEFPRIVDQISTAAIFGIRLSVNGARKLPICGEVKFPRLAGVAISR
jgi:hypothetical protein